MSWHYEDDYLFEDLDDEHDSWLADQLIQDILHYEYAEYLWSSSMYSTDCSMEQYVDGGWNNVLHMFPPL